MDLSATQLEMARRNVPGATFLQADMTTLNFEPGSFDAVVAFCSLTHVPRDEQAGLLGRIRSWLRPGGLFLASMGADDEPGDVEPDWLGVDMYFSHFGAKANRRLVEGGSSSSDRSWRSNRKTATTRGSSGSSPGRHWGPESECAPISWH